MMPPTKSFHLCGLQSAQLRFSPDLKCSNFEYFLTLASTKMNVVYCYGKVSSSGHSFTAIISFAALVIGKEKTLERNGNH